MDTIQKHVTITLLTLFIGKLLLFGCSGADVGIVFALCGTLAVKEMLDKSKKTKEVEEFCKSSIKDIEEVVRKQNEVLKKQSEEIVTMKATIDAVRMSNGFRKTG